MTDEIGDRLEQALRESESFGVSDPVFEGPAEPRRDVVQKTSMFAPRRVQTSALP